MENYPFFTKMVDELIFHSESDPMLAESLKWLDEQAIKKNMSFYDVVFDVLYKKDIQDKAKRWVNDKNW